MHPAAMLQDQVALFIEREGLIAPGARVLVGLSGGVDSVVLTHLLARLGFGISAGHVNFGLRGEASDGDEAFVRAWCAGQEIPLDVARFDTRRLAREQGRSMHETARALRYEWFVQVAGERGCTSVAVGHHLDDQVETVLLNLFRGSGVEGLAGMSPSRPLEAASPVHLVRPLLGTRREAIEEYARSEGLTWRVDASNTDPHYRRGALRTVILPLIEQHFGPAALENVARAAGLVSSYVASDVSLPLALLFDRAAEGTAASLRLGVLRELPDVWRQRLVLEALQRWLPGAPRSEAAGEEVAALVEAQPGRRVHFAAGSVWRERDGLVFRRDDGAAAGPPAGEATTLEPGKEIPVAEGRLRLELLDAVPATLDEGARVALLDADRLAFPLGVRPWRPGDRLRPLGMEGTRLVSDLLTDAHVPSHRRSGVCVVTSRGEVVWVVGHRLSHDARVRPATQRVAKISYLSQDPDEPGGASL